MCLSQQQWHMTSCTAAWEYFLDISDLYSAKHVTIIKSLNKGVLCCLLSPVWGCCGLPVSLEGPLWRPEGSCWNPAEPWGSKSLCRNKTSACSSCQPTHTTHLEQDRQQGLEDWWGEKKRQTLKLITKRSQEMRLTYSEFNKNRNNQPYLNVIISHRKFSLFNQLHVLSPLTSSLTLSVQLYHCRWKCQLSH